MKKLLLVLALVGVMGLFAGKVEATPAWHLCSLDLVGFNAGNVYLRVTDLNSGVQRSVVAPSDPAQMNRLLAVALTCLSGGLTTVALYDETVDYSTITALYATP